MTHSYWGTLQPSCPGLSGASRIFTTENSEDTEYLYSNPLSVLCALCGEFLFPLTLSLSPKGARERTASSLSLWERQA